MSSTGEMQRKAEARGLEGLTAGYRPLPGVFDEMVDAAGAVRPAFAPLLTALAALGPAELGRRFDSADRHLRESGVSYRAYDDPTGNERPWPLAHVPLVVGAQEWQELSRGLIQRAELLEAVLKDAYGPGELVASGVLPGAAIAGSPDFLRPMVGVTPPGGHHLHFYAADLGRGPDGRWWVLSDRTQAPSGAGYALENRIALSRALPDVYRELNVERLATFFNTFRAALTGLNRRDDTRVCLLTPGPLAETYFEHAYLARYLGFLLVEGGDLTVRGDTLYIRTVAGLRRAEVLLRRLDADFADPLELNVASQLGVPGLAQAVRAGKVAIANSLGSGLVEARVLMGFLPALARQVLGEDLILPNIATWWCGQERERAEVLERLDGMVVAPAFGASLSGVLEKGPVLGATLGSRERARLVDAIGRRGVDVVGQEIVQLSTAPVWRRGKLEPKPCILRVFLARTERGWTVMPGAFCRVSERVDARAVTMQEGVRSADVWVLADGPVEATTLLPSPEHVPIRRSTGVLPSRAADNLFWLGRYIERAEATLRVVRALTGRPQEGSGGATLAVARLIQLLVGWDAVQPNGERPLAAPLALSVLHGTERGGSVPALIGAAQRTASVIRDRLSPDAWRTLSDIAQLIAGPPAAAATETDALETANQALRMLSAFSGLAQENMNRLTGWRFLEIGRRIERAIATCRFARRFADADTAAPLLDLLLELADSQITYRLRYVMAAARAPVLDLVVLDGNNPRSVAFQADRIAEHLEVLPGHALDGLLTPSERLAQRLAGDLKTSNPASIRGDDLFGVEQRFMTLSDEIALRFFTHRGAPGAQWDGLG